MHVEGEQTRENGTSSQNCAKVHHVFRPKAMVFDVFVDFCSEKSWNVHLDIFRWNYRDYVLFQGQKV